nr:DUF397 domain-containing protein [Catenuloplanes japonicus]
MDLTAAAWRTSSRSNSQGNCVELATNVPGVVPVRDSKDREGGTLTIGTAAWSAFMGATKRTALDH